jgi:hypothetical protein
VQRTLSLVEVLSGQSPQFLEGFWWVWDGEFFETSGRQVGGLWHWHGLIRALARAEEDYVGVGGTAVESVV